MSEKQKPLAWIGVFDGEPDPEFIWHDEANARRWINNRPGVEMAPLAIAPTLTDAEREAMSVALDFCERTDRPLPTSGQIATLRGLLERLGGGA